MEGNTGRRELQPDSRPLVSFTVRLVRTFQVLWPHCLMDGMDAYA
jgi:hypothetical protein